jgi:hypothetical protein
MFAIPKGSEIEKSWLSPAVDPLIKLNPKVKDPSHKRAVVPHGEERCASLSVSAGMGNKTRIALLVMQITATIVVWEMGKAGITATNPLALSTLKPASVAVAPANDKRLTAVRNELKQTKAELDTLLVERASDAKQTIKETLSVTPIKDELQKQGNRQAEPEC